MTLDELIQRLNAVKATEGGNLKVIVAFPGTLIDIVVWEDKLSLRGDKK